jgi:hypothetical protein
MKVDSFIKLKDNRLGNNKRVKTLENAGRLARQH